MFNETDKTVFVERDSSGAIKGVYLRPQLSYAEEELLESDPQVAAFQVPAKATTVPTSVEEKLARIGLTIEQLKQELDKP